MRLINIYEKLLNAYPKSYQKDYANEMARTLEDMLRDEPKVFKRVKIWITAFVELPVHVTKLNADIVGQSYAIDTPTYVKRNTHLSITLIIPFVALMLINELKPSALPTAPSWTDVYQIMAIGLPAAAFLVCTLTVLRLLYVRRANQAGLGSNRLADVRHNWPIAAVGGLACLIVLFMAGHDTVHCVAANPIKVVHNPSATLQCIAKD